MRKAAFAGLSGGFSARSFVVGPGDLLAIGVSASMSGDVLAITRFTALPAPTVTLAGDALTVAAFATHAAPAATFSGDTLTIGRIA